MAAEVQLPPRNWESVFTTGSDIVKNDINDILNSDRQCLQRYERDYYATPQIAKKLRDVNSGIDEMKLDNTLMANSPSWRDKFDQQSLQVEKQGGNSALATTRDVLSEYKQGMTGENLQRLQDTQLKEVHHVANLKLQNAKQELTPYWQASRQRIDEFSDKVGVTDRFTGYRNNLSRGSRDAFRLGLTSTWKDHSKRGGYNQSLSGALNNLPMGFTDSFPWKNQSAQYSTDNRMRTASAPAVSFAAKPDGMLTAGELAQQQQNKKCCSTEHLISERKACGERCPVNTSRILRCPRSITAQVASGINLVYPGTSEYTSRYLPIRAGLLSSSFIINPTPQYECTGRPLAGLEYSRPHSEYETRFDWPEASKLPRLPWRR